MIRSLGIVLLYSCVCVTGLQAASNLLKDINTVPAATANSNPNSYISLGNLVIFKASTAANGEELWVSDGTANGTFMLKDIYSGATGSSINNLTLSGNFIYFTANDGMNGTELWRTDGTALGTIILELWAGGLNSSAPEQLTNVNGILFFVATNGTTGLELCRSNGFTGATNTYVVINLNGTTAGSTIGNLTAVGNVCYFTGNDGTTGVELWRSTGAVGHAKQIKDLFVGSNSSNPEFLTLVGTQLFFRANNGVNGTELFVHDTTQPDPPPAFTVTLLNIASDGGGIVSSSPEQLTSCNGKLIFTAIDGLHGREPWVSDGTAVSVGTNMLADILLNSGASDPQQLTCVHNCAAPHYVYFTATETNKGRELYRTDGTAVGTFRITDINPNAFHANPTILKPYNYDPLLMQLGCGTLFFTATDGTPGLILYRTNGRAVDDWALVKDIYPGFDPNVLDLLYVPSRGVVVFSALDPTAGQEVFVSNGLTANTVVLDNIFTPDTPTVQSSQPRYFTLCGNNIFFSASNSANGRELWMLPLAQLPAARTLSINDVATTEGNAGFKNFTFTVTLSSATGVSVCVDWTTQDVTAIAPGDYTATSGTLTFFPGDVSKQIIIQVAGNTVPEADETFNVLLSNPCNATILDGTGVGTIQNDEPNNVPTITSGPTATPNPTTLGP